MYRALLHQRGPPSLINPRCRLPYYTRQWKTNKVVWTWKDYWPPWRTSTYKRPFTREGNYLVAIGHACMSIDTNVFDSSSFHGYIKVLDNLTWYSCSYAITQTITELQTAFTHNDRWMFAKDAFIIPYLYIGCIDLGVV